MYISALSSGVSWFVTSCFLHNVMNHTTNLQYILVVDKLNFLK